MKKAKDPDHAKLSEVLQSLISSDTDITLRELARLHPELKHASDFSRSAKRMEIIHKAKQRQEDARKVVAAPHRSKAISLEATLAIRDARVAELEKQVRSLVASHAACVRAVLIHGGMQALRRFWKDYSAIGNDVVLLNAVPPAADIIPIRANQLE